MEVIVVESEPGAAVPAIGALEAAGHRVHRCHEPGSPAFPCNGLLDGDCPLESTGIDVALTVRPRVRPTPSRLEDGAACAIRHGVPLVLAGPGAMSPYERWDVREVTDRTPAAIATACEDAHRDALAAIAEQIREIVEVRLARRGFDGHEVEVAVARRDLEIRIEVVAPEAVEGVDGALGTALIAQVRSRLPWVRTVDVIVRANDFRGERTEVES